MYRVVCRIGCFLALAAVVVSVNAASAQTPPAGRLPALTVVVRHAEKIAVTDDDVPLSNAGMQRAKELAAVLRGVRFNAVLATSYIRTKATAEPTAAALGLTPEIIPIGQDLESHVTAVADAVRKHPGGAVLVVNHSNLIAAIIAQLGGPRLESDLICENIYDHLFVLTPVGGRVELVAARYGVRSPRPGPDCM